MLDIVGGFHTEIVSHRWVVTPGHNDPSGRAVRQFVRAEHPEAPRIGTGTDAMAVSRYGHPMIRETRESPETHEALEVLEVRAVVDIAGGAAVRS